MHLGNLKVETDPMAVHGIGGHRHGNREEGEEPTSKYLFQPRYGERAG